MPPQRFIPLSSLRASAVFLNIAGYFAERILIGAA